MLRKLMLDVAAQPCLQSLVTEEAVGRELALRFVAGETEDDGVRTTRALNARGMKVTLDHLGENTTNLSEARIAAAAYLQLLDRIEAEHLDANVSLKLTQLGLDVNEAFCERSLREIVGRAAAQGNFVRIDMESSAYTERTLALFRRVYADFPGAVGPVIQACLYRSGADVNLLIRLGARVRLCKGAYAEPASIAYQDKRDVDRSYKRLSELLIGLGTYPGIATHDAAMIDHAKRVAREFEIPRDGFELQMLYGVRRDLQQQLVQQGYRVRVYVPYGAAWYPYLTRRLAERPANALFVLRSLAKEALNGRP